MRPQPGNALQEGREKKGGSDIGLRGQIRECIECVHCQDWAIARCCPAYYTDLGAAASC